MCWTSYEPTVVCWSFGDVKEGLRFCSLVVVGEEAWIDQV